MNIMRKSDVVYLFTDEDKVRCGLGLPNENSKQKARSIFCGLFALNFQSVKGKVKSERVRD
jgi:hypothetical protein